jgi:hypothetical protein
MQKLASDLGLASGGAPWRFQSDGPEGTDLINQEVNFPAGRVDVLATFNGRRRLLLQRWNNVLLKMLKLLRNVSLLPFPKSFLTVGRRSRGPAALGLVHGRPAWRSSGESAVRNDAGTGWPGAPHVRVVENRETVVLLHITFAIRVP